MTLRGKRPSGKPKKKSKKVRVTSKFNSKRKLSRMGKKVKEGRAGPSTEYITRSSALRKLQITLKDFRRLCILKGIYPRVPNKPPKGADKVYYDIKDLAHLAHEPLLVKFREFKTFMRRVKNAAGRNQTSEARRKNDDKPTIVLDHLVKERYPRFIDALGDLDDALCMIHLFAVLPSVGRITVEKTQNCQNLVSYWQYYVAKSRSLRKVFVSVKGTYFQCEVMGEVITWLTPHSFTQKLPKQVDFRVMLTFLDFYEVFLKFVLFKLYSTLGISYPPTVSDAMRDCGGFLLSINTTYNPSSSSSTTAITNESNDTTNSTNQKKGLGNKDKEKIKKLEQKLISLEEQDEDDSDDEEDKVNITGPLTEAFAGFSESIVTNNSDVDGIDEKDREIFQNNTEQNESNTNSEINSNLFQGLCFFVSREVPLEILQICILSFGGLLGWESDTGTSPISKNDSRITHHIVDRPKLSDDVIIGREYIQPQWVFDSINAQLLLPVHRYRMGAILPPHLSPFVNDEKEGYLPTYREELRKLKSSVEIREKIEKGEPVEEESDEESEDEAERYARELEAEKNGVSFSVHQQEELESSEDEDDEEEEEDDDDSEEEDEEDEDEDNEGDSDENEDDEEEEDKPILEKKGPKGVVYDPNSGRKSKSQEDEESSLPHIMMSKKTKRLYGRMQHGIQKKKDSIERLVEKRKIIESESEPTSSKSKSTNQSNQNNSKKAKITK